MYIFLLPLSQPPDIIPYPKALPSHKMFRFVCKIILVPIIDVFNMPKIGSKFYWSKEYELTNGVSRYSAYALGTKTETKWKSLFS